MWASIWNRVRFEFMSMNCWTWLIRIRNRFCIILSFRRYWSATATASVEAATTVSISRVCVTGVATVFIHHTKKRTLTHKYYHQNFYMVGCCWFTFFFVLCIDYCSLWPVRCSMRFNVRDDSVEFSVNCIRI